MAAYQTAPTSFACGGSTYLDQQTLSSTQVLAILLDHCRCVATRTPPQTQAISCRARDPTPRAHQKRILVSILAAYPPTARRSQPLPLTSPHPHHSRCRYHCESEHQQGVYHPIEICSRTQSVLPHTCFLPPLPPEDLFPRDRERSTPNTRLAEPLQLLLVYFPWTERSYTRTATTSTPVSWRTRGPRVTRYDLNFFPSSEPAMCARL